MTIGKLLAAARAGLQDVLKAELRQLSEEDLAGAREAGTGLAPLHLASAGGYEECVEALLEAKADPLAVCSTQRTPLHYAAQSAIPMCAYQLASKVPAACLQLDMHGHTPIQLATASEKGEVLNAMLLACAGHASADALAATRALLVAGAVCDTWAPNGSSALMLAASADSAEGVGLLLDHAASLELQDALGRTALMFAAGNNARHALEALLDRGASVSIRDRRGRNVLDYAAADSEVRRVLEVRIAEMESKAARLQEELLAELLDDEAQQQGSKGGSKKSKKKKVKQGRAKSAPGSGEQPAVASQQAAVAEASAVTEQPPAVTEHTEKQEQLQLDDTTDQQQQQQEEEQQQESRPCAEPCCAAPLPIKAPADKSISDDDQQRGSFEWQVVGRRKREEQQQHLIQQHLDASSGAPLRRCPSASSLGSSCSGESHDTAGSSQRSVLIPPSRSSSAARGHLTAKPAAVHHSQTVVAAAAPGRAKPAWGKPVAAVPAHSQQQQEQPLPPLPAPTVNDDAAFPPLAAVVLQQKQAQHVQPSSKVAEGQQSGITDSSSAPSGSSSAGSTAQVQGEQAPAQSAGPAVGAAAAAVAAALPASLPGTSPSPAPPQLQPQPPLLPVPAPAEGEVAMLAAEVAALRAEVARLRLAQQQAEAAHQGELASVLEDTAAHEAAAVAQAVAAERMQCTYRFAAFLQNNHLAGDLLASLGIATTARGFPSVSAAGIAAAAPPPAQPAALEGFLGFPPLDGSRGFTAKSAPLGNPALGVGGQGGRAAAPASAASTAPLFFADLEQRLRTEYSGNVSQFVVPASEAEAAAPLPLRVIF